MKKLLIGLLLLLPLFCSGGSVSGDVVDDGYLMMMAMPKFPAGMTYLALFDDAVLDADRSGGSPTSTYASSRSASNPHTYADENGILQLVTTSNIGVFPSGFYDATGFHLYTHRALKAESASTNLLKTTIFDADGNSDGVADNWGTPTVDVTYTLETDASLVGIAGGKVQKIVFSGSQGNTFTTLQQVSVNSSLTYTVSFWVKVDAINLGGSGLVEINGDGGFSTIFLLLYESETTHGWRRFTQQITTTGSQTNLAIRIGRDVAGSSTGTSYYFGVQIEESPFATSFIPTTTAALTRNLESNKYETAGNRTKAVETMVIKFSVEHTSTELTSTVRIVETATKRRKLSISSSGNDVFFQPNETDNAGVIARTSSVLTKNIEYTIGYNCQHSSPFAEIYQDGVSIDTYTIGDWTNPDWGTFFHVGNTDGNVDQLNGVILGIAFFDRVLSDAEHLFLHTKDWRTLR